MALTSALSLSLLFISVLFGILLQPLSFNSHKVFSNDNAVQRVLLLTAHPDDECMFFAPTILSLISPTPSTSHDSISTELFSLCLSVGDADGQGPERVKELGRSLDVLGVNEDRRWILDTP